MCVDFSWTVSGDDLVWMVVLKHERGSDLLRAREWALGVMLLFSTLNSTISKAMMLFREFPLRNSGQCKGVISPEVPGQSAQRHGIVLTTGLCPWEMFR